MAAPVFNFLDQLWGEWKTARGYLVEGLAQLNAALAQAFDTKNWRLQTSNTTFSLGIQPENAQDPSAVLSVDSGGGVTTFLTKGGSVHVKANVNSAAAFALTNTSNAAGAYTAIHMQNDTATTRFVVRGTSTGYNASPLFPADSLTLYSAGANGLNFHATSSGGVNFMLAGNTTPRFSLANGHAAFTTTASFVANNSSTTLALGRTSAASSGVAEGGIRFNGFGIQHGGLWYVPRSSGSSLHLGFGSGADVGSYTRGNARLFDRFSLASGSSFTLTGGNQVCGLLILASMTQGSVGLFMLRGGAQSTLVITDAFGHFSNALGTAGRINVGWNGSSYAIQNNSAGSVNMQLTLLGYV